MKAVTYDTDSELAYIYVLPLKKEQECTDCGAQSQ